MRGDLMLPPRGASWPPLLQAYDTDGAEPTPERVQRVVNLIEAFPGEGATPEDAPPVEDCTKFASAAVRWIKR